MCRDEYADTATCRGRLGGETMSASRLGLAGGVTDPAQARHFLRATLQAWEVAGPVADTAVLLLSEVVTNAVRHAPGPAEVEVVLDLRPGAHAALRVSVLDRGEPAPLPACASTVSLSAEGGRGLFLLGELADRWGSDPNPGAGKHVWFELSA